MPEGRWPSAGELAADRCAALLEAARPSLYRTNAFRVTELPVDATARDISRQAQRARMQEKYGRGANTTRGALPLDPPPDADAVREAMQRLRDPERRLVDELFWFWPAQLGQSRTDEALGALAQGDVDEAVRAWIERERAHSESNVSAHNLAILYHALALDLEHASQQSPLSGQEEARRSQYWQGAFRRWKILLHHEGFWSRFAARIRELDDPRLTTGTARRIRATLPLALLSVNAQLALRAAEQAAAAEAQRHLSIMQSWEDAKVAEEALLNTIKPVRERVKMLCKSAAEQAEADPAHADETVRRLLEQTRPLLAILDCLLPQDSFTRESVHDEVALRALGCMVGYGNKTENWKVCVERLKPLVAVAVSDSARGRLEENLKIAEDSLAFATCWFCREGAGEAGSVVEIKMHGNVVRTPTWQGTEIRWQHCTVKVPRCARCKAFHARSGAATAVGTVLGALAGIAGCVAIVNASSEAGVAGVIVFGVLLAIGAGFGHHIEKRNAPKGIAPESTKTQHPAVKGLLDQGWRLGERPGA